MSILSRSSTRTLLAVLASTAVAGAQTYRGGIAGTVTDASGAAVPNARVTLTNPENGYSREMQSTSAGAYTFQDLQPNAAYVITVTSSGFGTIKIEKISVQPGQVYSLDPKLSVTGSESVEVNAAAISLDTESSTNNNVVNSVAVQNIPLNGRDYTQLIKITPGYNGAGSLNGARTNQNNYQIDGADSNDIWQNGAAANQSGVNGIAGVTIPLEAIDQFTVQSSGNAEAGRNAGSLISLAIKTGTNSIHGSAYYYTRNEFFAARSPFLLSSQRKPKLRNAQFGASLGGPIIKDKLFGFVNYERQKFVIQSTSAATVPTATYVAAATSLLRAHGQTVNPLSLSVLSLFPTGNATAASIGNYLEPQPQVGYSDNSIGNLLYNLSDKQSLKLQAFVGTGRQIAPVGSYVYPYFEVAPDITQNFSLSHNYAITSRLSNQFLIAVGIFNQTFNDAVHNQNIPALGLNTGVTDPGLFGAPSITITSFDQTGATQPLGRKDYTGHITDVATWIKGKHELRIGGEFRRNYMDLQYQRNVRGSFSFNGTATSNAGLRTALGISTAPGSAKTPYACNTGEANCTTDTSFGGSEVRSLADYLGGYVASSSFTQGVLRRDIYQNTYSVFASDAYKISPSFTLNYGVRYEYNGSLSTTGQFSDYRPTAAGADAFGLIAVGKSGTPALYDASKANVAPRVGFAYQPNERMVFRGQWGIYFDAPNFNGFFDNRPGNNAAVGPQANPFGASPVRNVAPTFYQWQTGVNPFAASPLTVAGTPPGTTFGLASVSPDFKTAYAQNFGFNTEYQISHNTVMTLAYVGSIGRRLFNLSDINQAVPYTGQPGQIAGNSTAAIQSRRPINVAKTVINAPIIGAVNEIQSNGYSNHNSLQATIKTSSFHGLTGQASYTWGHSLDVISSTRGLAPQNSANLNGDYGDSDFDVRSTFNGYVVYEAPQIGHHVAVLTKGWQGNLFTTAFTGTPFSIKVGSDISGTGENQDRVNYNGQGYKGSSALIPQAGAAPYAQFLVATNLSAPAANTFGNSRRNAFRGPGFFTMDASLVKNTKLSERVNLQLRAETFNIANRINLANPTSTSSSGSFGRITATRNSGSATGIGPGEPFNVQFAGKLIF
ncbi:MAG: TonB-dependent receptor [Janthinobacterium lividum]